MLAFSKRIDGEQGTTLSTSGTLKRPRTAFFPKSSFLFSLSSMIDTNCEHSQGRDLDGGKTFTKLSNKVEKRGNFALMVLSLKLWQRLLIELYSKFRLNFHY